MLRTLFVFAILIPGLVAALTNRFAALLLYVWIALFRPQEFTWVDLNYLHISLIAGGILVVPSLLSGTWPNVSHPLSIGGLLFFATALLAQTNAVNPEIGWFWIDFLGRLVLICLLAVTLTNSRERFVMLLGVIAVSFGFHTAKAGLSSVLRGGSRFADGLAGAFSDNNGYALGMVMTLWLLVAAGQHAKRVWLKNALFLAALLTAFAAISTFSRGGFVALVASASVFLLLQRRRSTAAIILAILLLIVPFVPLPEGYVERIRTIKTYDDEGDTSALGRLHFWKVAVDIASAHPLGVGLFNYESVYDRYDSSGGQYGSRRSVHSSFFQVLAETGLAGAAVYCSMIVYSLLLVLRIRRRARAPNLDADGARLLETSANALGASVVAFIGGGAFIALALNDLTWLIFALLASLDRLSRQMCEASEVVPATSDAVRPSPSTSAYSSPSFAHFIPRKHGGDVSASVAMRTSVNKRGL